MAKTASKLDPEVLDELFKGVSSERDLSGALKQLSKNSSSGRWKRR